MSIKYRIVLYCIVLYYIVLYCIVLYCIVLPWIGQLPHSLKKCVDYTEWEKSIEVKIAASTATAPGSGLNDTY